MKKKVKGRNNIFFYIYFLFFTFFIKKFLTALKILFLYFYTLNIIFTKKDLIGI